MTDWRRVGRGVTASTRWKQNTDACFSNDLGVVCPLRGASEREKTGRLFRGKSRNFSAPPGMSGTRRVAGDGVKHLTRDQTEIDCVTRIVTSFVDRANQPAQVSTLRSSAPHLRAKCSLEMQLFE